MKKNRARHTFSFTFGISSSLPHLENIPWGKRPNIGDFSKKEARQNRAVPLLFPSLFRNCPHVDGAGLFLEEWRVERGSSVCSSDFIRSAF